MATIALQTFPVELILEIFSHLQMKDLRTLRLVNRHFGSIANSLALKFVTFCMCKRDFDMLRELMKQPDLLQHIQSLVYVVDTLSLEPQTFEMYRRAVDRDDILKVSVGKWLGRDQEEPTPMSAVELRQNFERYRQFFKEQEDILGHTRDYELLKELVAILPNLKEINVSSDIEIASVNKSPFESCRKVCDGQFIDGQMSTRHLQAMLRAIEKSAVRLQTLRAFTVHYDMFDKGSFGLHKITDLLGNITFFELGIDAVEESHLPIGMRDPYEIVGDLLECNKTMKEGTLQRVLAAMPNLVTLKLSFIENHELNQSNLPPPALLNDVLPRRVKWPRLKELLLSNVMTDRQPLAKFLLRHRESLKIVRLDQIRLATTSWMKLLPMLRKIFAGSGVDVTVSEFIMSASESDDAPSTLEMWDLGEPPIDDAVPPRFQLPESSEANQLGMAVRRYITLKDRQECPLRADNMHFWESEEEEDELEFFDEDEVFWEDELEDDDDLPDLVPID